MPLHPLARSLFLKLRLGNTVRFERVVAPRQGEIAGRDES
jgi:hypothetical protein